MARPPYPNFLIVGCERSGTHWVAALLNAHPSVACFPTLPFFNARGESRVGEMHFFNTLASLDPRNAGKEDEKFIRPFSDFAEKYRRAFADLVPLKDELPLRELYRVFSERYSEFCDRERGGKRLVGEGTPAYVFHLDFIDELFPGMKKIASIRDPKDKIVSWHFNMLRKGRKEGGPITEDFALGYLEKRIVPEYEALLAYEGDVHCLTYERLAARTLESAGEMLSYLGVSATDEELRTTVAEASFEKQTARDSGTARKPGEEDPMSGLRKGIVGDWKNHISPELAREIDERTKDLRTAVFEKYRVAV